MFDKDQLEMCMDIAAIPTLIHTVNEDLAINDRDKARLLLGLQSLILDIADKVTVGEGGGGYSGVDMARNLIEKYKN